MKKFWVFRKTACAGVVTRGTGACRPWCFLLYDLSFCSATGDMLCLPGMVVVSALFCPEEMTRVCLR